MAKRFKFNLDKIMGLKKQELKMKEIEMASLLGEIKLKRDLLENLEDQISQYRNRLSQNIKNVSLAGDIQKFNEFILSLHNKSDEDRKVLADLNAILNKNKNEYIEKRKEVMTFEKLYARKYNLYLKDVAKEEQKNLDELSLRKR
ncbi:MAG: flagellar export protein FliJ [Planctomycetes bacterium]|nr:flagellar export protein FliJ [Planctomycetota bacterium]